MANLAFQVTGFAFQGAGQFTYQGSTDETAAGDVRRGRYRRRIILPDKREIVAKNPAQYRRELARLLAEHMPEAVERQPPVMLPAATKAARKVKHLGIVSHETKLKPQVFEALNRVHAERLELIQLLAIAAHALKQQEDDAIMLLLAMEVL